MMIMMVMMMMIMRRRRRIRRKQEQRHNTICYLFCAMCNGSLRHVPKHNTALAGEQCRRNKNTVTVKDLEQAGESAGGGDRTWSTVEVFPSVLDRITKQ